MVAIRIEIGLRLRLIRFASVLPRPRPVFSLIVKSRSRKWCKSIERETENELRETEKIRETKNKNENKNVSSSSYRRTR